MTDRQLPHDSYITAVCDALTAARLIPADAFTEDTDSRGTYCYLRAVITLDDSSGIDPARFRHGLLLIWEWHTGAEADAGEPDRGPSWQWARLVDEHGKSSEPEALALDGYSSPAHIVGCVHSLLGQHKGDLPRGRWEHAEQLDAACEAWGTAETSE